MGIGDAVVSVSDQIKAAGHRRFCRKHRRVEGLLHLGPVTESTGPLGHWATGPGFSRLLLLFFLEMVLLLPCP